MHETLVEEGCHFSTEHIIIENTPGLVEFDKNASAQKCFAAVGPAELSLEEFVKSCGSISVSVKHEQMYDAPHLTERSYPAQIASFTETKNR